MMFGSWITTACLALGTVAFPCGDTRAGWICIKNETKNTLFVQDAPSTPNGKAGKLVRLLPGETYREFQTEPGEKKLNIYDAKHSKEARKPLCEGKMIWTNDDIKMRIYSEKDEIKFGPVPPPEVKSEETVKPNPKNRDSTPPTSDAPATSKK